MARLDSMQSGGPPPSVHVATNFAIRFKKWFIGAGAVLALLIVSLIIWGPEMEFPTTVSTVESTGDSSVELKRTVRQVTGDAIDDTVDWITVKANWLFDGTAPP